jgi:arabinogalactan endo-1,4-beta-galactosidase
MKTERFSLSRHALQLALSALLCTLPASLLIAASPPADNLALGKPIVASSTGGTNVAARAVDYRFATNWQAGAFGAGQWLRVDLGSPQVISGVEFRFNNGSTQRGYTVEISDDDASWTTVVTAASASTQVRYHPFDTTARYVRWTLTALSAGTVQMSEFWVFGPPVVALPPIPHVSDPAPPYLNTSFVRGADVSHLLQNEHYGARYFDENNVESDPLHILRDRGINVIRIKVWNDPGNRAFTPARLHDPLGFNNAYWVTRLAVRARELGFRIMIDFHYSDTWADPGKQFIPHEWLGLPPDEVALRLYDFTYDTLATLQAHGVTPEWVQVGNESGGGIMWPLGQYWNAAQGGSWGNLAMFFTAGYEAVKAVDPSIKVVIHHAESGNLGATRFFYDNLVANSIPWDVIGLSYYPQWHGTFDAMTNSMHQLTAVYNKPVIIVEAAHPWTTQGFDETGNALGLPAGFPHGASVDGQIGYLDEVVTRIKSVPNGMGHGLIYWEPEWTTFPGMLPTSTSIAKGGAGWAIGEASGWENAALFNQNGVVLESMSALGNQAPVVDIGSDPSVTILKGATFESAGSFADTGVNTWTATVDYDDGSGADALELQDDQTFALGHTFAEVGVYDVEVAVTDDEARTGTDATEVTVIYDFSGFFGPVASAPATNVVSAGSVVSIQFSLAGDQGPSVLAAGYPKSRPVNCNTAAPTGASTPTAGARAKALSYDSQTNQYVYVWKTDKAWAGTCRELIVKLADGTEHFARFSFK